MTRLIPGVFGQRKALFWRLFRIDNSPTLTRLIPVVSATQGLCLEIFHNWRFSLFIQVNAFCFGQHKACSKNMQRQLCSLYSLVNTLCPDQTKSPFNEIPELKLLPLLLFKQLILALPRTKRRTFRIEVLPSPQPSVVLRAPRLPFLYFGSTALPPSSYPEPWPSL